MNTPMKLESAMRREAVISPAVFDAIYTEADRIAPEYNFDIDNRTADVEVVLEVEIEGEIANLTASVWCERIYHPAFRAKDESLEVYRYIGDLSLSDSNDEPIDIAPSDPSMLTHHTEECIAC